MRGTVREQVLVKGWSEILLNDFRKHTGVCKNNCGQSGFVLNYLRVSSSIFIFSGIFKQLQEVFGWHSGSAYSVALGSEQTRLGIGSNSSYFWRCFFMKYVFVGICLHSLTGHSIHLGIRRKRSCYFYKWLVFDLSTHFLGSAI
jgi:hypothetical protein